MVRFLPPMLMLLRLLRLRLRMWMRRGRPRLRGDATVALVLCMRLGGVVVAAAGLGMLRALGGVGLGEGGGETIMSAICTQKGEGKGARLFGNRTEQKLTLLKDTDHPATITALLERVLPAEGLGAEDLILAHGLAPIEVHIEVLAIDTTPTAPSTTTTTPRSTTPTTAGRRNADAETAREPVTPTVLGRDGALERGAPALALLAVVVGVRVRHGYVYL